jgi:hypothetical protein
MGIILIVWFVYEIFRLRRQVSGIKRAQLNYLPRPFYFCMGALSQNPQLFEDSVSASLSSYFSLPGGPDVHAITRYRRLISQAFFPASSP